MQNRLKVKLSASPSGLVKVSEGLGARKAKSDALIPSDLSIVPNFKNDDDPLADEILPLSDDCPAYPAPRVGWGLLGKKSSMSRKSCRAVRERMCAVEIEYGKDNCLFVTLTLPSDCSRSFEMLARFSSFSVNRIAQFLRDSYSEVEFSRVGVWEYQKRGAPHYHMLLGSHCMDAVDLDVFRGKIAVAWMHILESIEQECDVNCFQENGVTRDKNRLLDYDDLGKRFANVQIVQKSVCAYLSSYLSGSNHDSGKDKNGLRKKLFPFGTWAQWDRSATALFRKYSVECEVVIWAKNYDDWSDLKSILCASIERAEGTDCLKRKNQFYETVTMISAKKGGELTNILEDFLGILDDSGIVSTFANTFKFVKKAEKNNLHLLAVDIHDADFLYWEHCQGFKSELESTTKRVTDDMNNLLLNMLLFEQELREHKAFNSDLENSQQLELLEP